MSVRATNKLTDRGIKAWLAKAQRGQKRSDGSGMFLTLTPAGTPAWRVKYRLGGKERVYAIGIYPAISLDQARTHREVVKSHLREGRDPVTARRVEKAASAAASDETFESVAAAWFAKQKPQWSEVHYTKSRRAFDRDVLPFLGKLPVSKITTPMVASIIESVARRGARDTAAKVLWHCSSVFRHAQARGLCATDPADPVRELLTKKKKRRRMPAILTFSGLGDILRSAHEANMSRTVFLAHRLCAYSVARIGNVVEAEWTEFDLDQTQGTWIIPRAKMKAQDRHHDHKIMLPPNMAAELRDWRKAIGGRGYVFPGRKLGRHITRESLEKAYRVTLALNRKHTPHGWRAAFSTLARDHGFERDVVELTLDHIHDTDVARAYDRGERMVQRIDLMKWWGDQLFHAEHGAEVLPMKQARPY